MIANCTESSVAQYYLTLNACVICMYMFRFHTEFEKQQVPPVLFFLLKKLSFFKHLRYVIFTAFKFFSPSPSPSFPLDTKSFRRLQDGIGANKDSDACKGCRFLKQTSVAKSCLGDCLGCVSAHVVRGTVGEDKIDDIVKLYIEVCKI